MKTQEIKHWSGRLLYTTEVADDDPRPLLTALARAVAAGQPPDQLREQLIELAGLVDHAGALSAAGMRVTLGAIQRELDAPSASVSLDGARLDRAFLDGAYLDGACLNRASLVGASLDRANLNRASLDRANLNRASLNRASLDGASLDDASLDGASLDGASLDQANLNSASLNRTSLDGACLDGASLGGACLDGACLDGACLDGASLDCASLDGASLDRASLDCASLDGASLGGARLTGARLDRIRADVRAVLDRAPDEVSGLLRALREGRINGSVYSGECACLVGTIGKPRGCAYDAVPGLKPKAERPAERWFLAIKPGLTPANHQVAAITERWILEWMLEHATTALAAAPPEAASCTHDETSRPPEPLVGP